MKTIPRIRTLAAHRSLPESEPPARARLLPVAEVLVSRPGAERLHVEDDEGIVPENLQYGPIGQGPQSVPRSKDRDGASQPTRIEDVGCAGDGGSGLHVLGGHRRDTSTPPLASQTEAGRGGSV